MRLKILLKTEKYNSFTENGNGTRPNIEDLLNVNTVSCLTSEGLSFITCQIMKLHRI